MMRLPKRALPAGEVLLHPFRKPNHRRIVRAPVLLFLQKARSTAQERPTRPPAVARLRLIPPGPAPQRRSAAGRSPRPVLPRSFPGAPSPGAGRHRVSGALPRPAENDPPPFSIAPRPRSGIVLQQQPPPFFTASANGASRGFASRSVEALVHRGNNLGRWLRG